MVAVVGGVIVVGGVTERASLMVLEHYGADERSERPGSTSAGGGRIGNIGAVGKFNADHGGHGLGGGQGGGYDTGRGRVTCFAGALLLIFVWSGAIKKLSG